MTTSGNALLDSRIVGSDTATPSLVHCAPSCSRFGGTTATDCT
jgi:hypothetical protein